MRKTSQSNDKEAELLSINTSTGSARATGSVNDIAAAASAAPYAHVEVKSAAPLSMTTALLTSKRDDKWSLLTIYNRMGSKLCRGGRVPTFIQSLVLISGPQLIINGVSESDKDRETNIARTTVFFV